MKLGNMFQILLGALIISLTISVQAETTGLVLSSLQVTVSAGNQGNFVASTTTEAPGASSGMYITVNDNSAGGNFYTGTITGSCNAITPDPDSRFAITNNKGVCYANPLPGNYALNVTLFDSSDVQIGEAQTIEFIVISTDPEIAIDRFATVASSNYDGLEVEFRLINVGNIENVNTVLVALYQNADQLLIAEGVQALLDLITAGTDQFDLTFITQLHTAPPVGNDLFVFSDFEFSTLTEPTSVQVIIIDQNDSYVAANSNLLEAVGASYLDIVPDDDDADDADNDNNDPGNCESCSSGGSVMLVAERLSNSNDDLITSNDENMNDTGEVLGASISISSETQVQSEAIQRVVVGIFDDQFTLEQQVDMIRVFKTFTGLN